ncbi:signal peptide peptidase-like 2A isoform X2 [Trichomycterus rosablanca]|uniref:signal peptide peptidase-like 2A isoform X2 n=1 Tax=Trichomycterus rosablanca TaxID=2290929 RepID=UPI002F34F3A3
MRSELWIILAVILLSYETEGQEAVLHVSDGNIQKDYCLVYNSSWFNVSTSLSDAVLYSLVNMTSSVLCNDSGLKPGSLKGAAVVVIDGSCNLSQKAQVAQEFGAEAIIITSVDAMRSSSISKSEHSNLTIPLALMRSQDFIDVLKVFSGNDTKVQMYAPPIPEFDFSILIMLVLAVFTVAMGGFWSGAAEREKLNARALSAGEDDSGGELSLYSPLKILLFVVLMCGMLLLMYFFYRYLVYVIIVIFCLASATGLYSCLKALLNAMGCSKLSVQCGERSCSVRNLMVAAVSITLAVVWGVYRNEDRWIWILQDLLGVAFCLNFMKTITLSNYKICVILLSLLLLYDVFFVFITPFFTPNGESIMVQVAMGPDAAGEKGSGDVVVPGDPSSSYEKIPVVMRIPRFAAWAQNLCMMQFSILGFGDIIIPGLLVAYCHRFDVWTGSSKIYYISCTVAYCLGMILTFVVMFLSKMGQPALLYLVPFTLITSGVLAWRRQEFKQFWAGTAYQVETLNILSP